MGGGKGTGLPLLPLVCAKCGGDIGMDGMRCFEANKVALFIRDKQPHYKTRSERDAALKALQEKHLSPIEFGTNEMDPDNPSYYLIDPTIEEEWGAKIKAGAIEGVIWHEPKLLPHGMYCICGKCSDAHGGKCPTCSEYLDSII